MLRQPGLAAENVVRRGFAHKILWVSGFDATRSFTLCSISARFGKNLFGPRFRKTLRDFAHLRRGKPVERNHRYTGDRRDIRFGRTLFCGHFASFILATSISTAP
jgi:hypothetical protein